MGEARQSCPFCNRDPGGIHTRACPRSAMFQRDRSLGTKIVKHMHHTNFVWRSVQLLTQEEIDRLPENVRKALAGDIRRSKIEVRVKGAIVPLFRVPVQGTYQKTRRQVVA